MATAPKINYFDGSGSTSELTVTTNLFSLVFDGTVDQNTIDVQIDFNGSGFISDPTLVGLTVPTFTIPNLNSHPEGLILERGTNIIRLRAIDLTGSVSAVSTITAVLVTDSDLETILSPPTGISLDRKATTVDVSWTDVQSTLATGYNIYCSTGPGGVGSGYLRVNQSIIPSNNPVETNILDFPLKSFEYDFSDSESLDLQIVLRTVDPISAAVVEQKVLNHIPLIQSPEYRVSTTVSSLQIEKKFVFSHDRDAGPATGILNNDVFSSINPENSLYYVVTAVYFNKADGILQESRFTEEVSGNPLPLDMTIRGIRIRDQRIISQDYILEVQKAEPTLSLIPASTVREVHIEPFSNEMQKVYFLTDFVHRSKSFPALIAIDDPTQSGISVPVSQSQYKQNLKTALSVSDDSSVQSLIDGAFETLAIQYGRKRSNARSAQVVQTFYTRVLPTKDLIVSQGAVVSSSTNTLAPRFISRGQVTLVATNAQAYYNVNKRRYELKIALTAEFAGSSGNVAAGDLDSIVSGANGFQTENEFQAEFGRDVQSNLELAVDGMQSLYSLDTGTYGGYLAKAIETPGLFDVRVVQSGDSEMMRDWDEIRAKHIGGKVDVWTRGTLERTVSETFAFQFSTAKNTRFDVIDATNLIFRARDSRLDVNNPIQEMLFNNSQNLGLRNHSIYPTTPYDLTGVTILDYRTIQLSILVPQPSTNLDDFVEGDYRFRSNNNFVATVQPIRRITSVTGTLSGTLDQTDGYDLFKTQDPLLYGESTAAQDYLQINQVNDIPSGNTIQVNDEVHTMIGEFEEPLGSVGVNTFSVAVYSVDRTILYNGPSTSNPDYLFIAGSQTAPFKIIRTTNSSIVSGSQISVDYEHDENFSINYVVNDVLQNLQARYEKTRHTTADVLVKQAVENPMSLQTTIQLRKNADQATTDKSIRDAISIILNKKKTGESIYQSDVVAAIEGVTGVDFIVQPFTRMTLQDGSVRIRDSIIPDYEFISSLSQGLSAVYILTQELPYATSDGGGTFNTHHGVYKDELIMEEASNLQDVGLGINRFYIIGNLGAVITGYSDDATLYPIFITQEAVAAERLVRTANRVIVSLDYGSIPIDIPSYHTFSATYIVSGDTGSKDLSTTGVEYLTPGAVTITYRSVPKT